MLRHSQFNYILIAGEELIHIQVFLNNLLRIVNFPLIPGVLFLGKKRRLKFFCSVHKKKCRNTCRAEVDCYGQGCFFMTQLINVARSIKPQGTVLGTGSRNPAGGTC